MSSCGTFKAIGLAPQGKQRSANENSGTLHGSFLTSEALQQEVRNHNAYTIEGEVEHWMKSNRYFYNVVPPSLGDGSQENWGSVGGASVHRCLDQFGDVARVRGFNDTLTVGLDWNGVACLRQAFTDEFVKSGGTAKVQVQVARIRMWMTFVCEGADFSPWNGMSLNEFKPLTEQALSECRSNGKFHTESEAIFSFDALTFFGSSHVEFHLVSFEGAEDMGSCEMQVNGEGRQIYADDCVKVQRSNWRSVNDGKSNIKESYERLHKVGVASEMDGESDLFFDEGQVEFQYNNWTGVVIYRGDEEVPTVEMHNTIDEYSVTDIFPLDKSESLP